MKDKFIKTGLDYGTEKNSQTEILALPDYRHDIVGSAIKST